MIGFQVFSLVVLVMFITAFVFLVRKKRGLIPTAAIVIVLGIIASIVVVLFDPLLAQKVAGWSGIGRGSDLVIYLAVLFLLFSSFANYLRIRRTHSKIAEIARKVALLNVHYPENKESKN